MKDLLPASRGVQIAASMIQQCGIMGLKDAARLQHLVVTAVEREADDVSVEWERAWTVGCGLRVGFVYETETRDGKRVRVARPRVEVSWSSTGRSVAAARASVALYSQVVDLAALIEAVLEEGAWGEVRS